MVVRRRKKHRRFRGRRTYHGSHKKWRGGGSRGGRGRAGMHKHKWSYTVKYKPEHFGKRGFKRPFAKKIKAITLRELQKLAEREGLKEIELSKYGYDKLLGSGKITKPLLVKVKLFTKLAKEKVESVGGKLILEK